jgi:hypothetical protein
MIDYTVSNIIAYCPIYNGVGWVSFVALLNGKGLAQTGAWLHSGFVTLFLPSEWGYSTLDSTDPAVISQLNSIISSDPDILAAISAILSAVIGPAIFFGLALVDGTTGDAVDDATVAVGDTLNAFILLYDDVPVPQATYTSLDAASTAVGVATVSSISTPEMFTITPVSSGMTDILITGTSSAGTVPMLSVPITVTGGGPTTGTSMSVAFTDPSTGLPSVTTTIGGTLLGTITVFDQFGNPGATYTSLSFLSTPTNISLSPITGLTFTITGVATPGDTVDLTGTSSIGGSFLVSPPFLNGTPITQFITVM